MKRKLKMRHCSNGRAAQSGRECVLLAFFLAPKEENDWNSDAVQRKQAEFCQRGGEANKHQRRRNRHSQKCEPYVWTDNNLFLFVLFVIVRSQSFTWILPLAQANPMQSTAWETKKRQKLVIWYGIHGSNKINRPFYTPKHGHTHIRSRQRFALYWCSATFQFFIELKNLFVTHPHKHTYEFMPTRVPNRPYIGVYALCSPFVSVSPFWRGNRPLTRCLLLIPFARFHSPNYIMCSKWHDLKRCLIFCVQRLFYFLRCVPECWDFFPIPAIFQHIEWIAHVPRKLLAKWCRSSFSPHLVGDWNAGEISFPAGWQRDHKTNFGFDSTGKWNCYFLVHLALGSTDWDCMPVNRNDVRDFVSLIRTRSVNGRVSERLSLRNK